MPQSNQQIQKQQGRESLHIVYDYRTATYGLSVLGGKCQEDQMFQISSNYFLPEVRLLPLCFVFFLIHHINFYAEFIASLQAVQSWGS